MTQHSNDPRQGPVKRAIVYGRKYIDYRMGIAGAIVMASVVFGINYYGTHNAWGATTAALKQGTYTFFFGGVIMKMSERLATGVHRRMLALVAACVIPSLVSLSLTFGVHSMKGTPKPVQSTIPTAIFVIPSTAVWGAVSRKRAESSQKKSPS